MDKPRRIQIFVEGGWYGLDEFVELVAAALADAITDDGEGGDKQPITKEQRIIIINTLRPKEPPPPPDERGTSWL